MKYYLVILLLLMSIKIKAINNLEIKENTPFTYVYMRFDGYHLNYHDFKSDFIKEIKKQNLQYELIGEPFNLYFSETDWTIACRINTNSVVQPPLIIDFYKNKKIAASIYDGSAQNIPSFLELLSSYITKKNYDWDGPLIINEINSEQGNLKYELVIPLTKNIYHIFIKPYGIVKILITFICLLFSIFLLSYKKGRILSNRILGIFTLICVLRDFSSYLWIYNINQRWPHLYDFGISLDFLFTPLLLLYTLSIVQENFKFKKLYILHFTPFFIIAIMYLIKFQLYDAVTKLELIKNFKYDPLIKIINYFKEIQIIIYLSISFMHIYMRNFKIKKTDLYIEKTIISTLKLLIIGLLILQVIGIINKYVITTKTAFHFTLKSINIILNLTLVSAILIRCLKYPEMFSYAITNGNGQKYNKSPLTNEHKEYYLKKVKSYMEETKPYLSSTISLPDLAKEISIPARYISQVLNEKLEMSFYDFMNKYRIDEAKNLLSQENLNDRSIINIAYDCGFNSKSVFNTSFKKYTGITPSEFRQNQKSLMNYELINN